MGSPLSGRRGSSHTRIGATGLEVLESRRMFDTAPISFQDVDGDTVTVQLFGPGTVDVQTSPRNVEVDGTTAASTLRLDVTRGPNGDGFATIGEIRSYRPIGAVIGKNVDVTHEISIDDLNIPVSSSEKVKINLGVMRSVALYTGGQYVSILRVRDWGPQPSGQEIYAPAIDQVFVMGRPEQSLPGNFAAALYLGDNGTTASTYSLGSISVPGALGDINASGRIGSIVAGSINGHLSASSFGSISAGTITGGIHATGAPGVQTSIGSITTNGGLSVLDVSTDQGDIGQITVNGDASGLQVDSAGAIGGVDVLGALYASRIQSLNNVDHVRVAALSDTDVQIGVAPGFNGTVVQRNNFANPNAQLGSFRISGARGSQPGLISGSNSLSTPKLGFARLRNPDDPTSIQIYMPGGAGPGEVNYISPSNSFDWFSGSAMPSALQQILVLNI